MKTARGFSLLEVLIALAVTSILLPVVGIVFYNLFVVPPDQAARLKINNEVSLLASFLYDDAHRCDNFSKGLSWPYYGNFAWTDYSTTNATYYLISYYATCQADDPGCSNMIVRSVNYTNGSTAPTATPTPTPTPSPTATPTPTPVPATQTYTYCDGGGDANQKWAWALAWNATEFFTQGRPTSTSDFFNTANRSLIDADANAYSALCNTDDSYWGNTDTASPRIYAADSQMYTINVSQNRSAVTNLSVTWRGYGGAFTQNTQFRIFNYSSGSWEVLVNKSDPDNKTSATYVNSKTSGITNYIQSGTGYVSFLATSDARGATPEDTNFGTALWFNGSADPYSNKVTASSSVPTNTFTIEAWVKPTTIHEIDAELTNYGGVSGQSYVFGAAHRGSDAGAGVSVGTNGISVYEHGSSYLPAVAVYSGALGTSWHHIAVVYNSKSVSIYLNGNLVRSVSSATIDTSYSANRSTVYAPYEIGNGSYGAFNGTIDEVRLWNVALNQTQIRTNMYREIPSPTSEANLVGYWKFSSDYEDSSSYNNDGTPSSSPPTFVSGLDRDMTVYTDYLGLYVVTPESSPTPTPTVSPPPSPVTYVTQFNSTGNTTWTVPDGVSSIQVLVVGGGGGGGGANVAYYNGGGGGAGGVVYNASYPVIAGTNVTVRVGAGGDGGSGTEASGDNGGYSSFNNSIFAGGGGGGGNGGSDLAPSSNMNGKSGGSGGGGAVQSLNYAAGSGGSAISGQGNTGGSGYYTCCWILVCTCWNRLTGGGGGGAGAVGADGASQDGGDGGSGVSYLATFGSVGGASGTFAGGGGGGAYTGSAGSASNGGGAGGVAANGNPGTDKTGGGGGGAGCTGTIRTGGKGGSGFVVLKYTVGYVTLNTSATAGGTCQPSPPGQNYYSGTVVPINATAATCYHFVNWSGSGVGKVANPNSDITTITMDASYTIQANFAANVSSYTLNVTASPPLGGNPSYAGTSPFACGFNASIYANMSGGYNFEGWTPTTGVADPSAQNTTVQMTADRYLIAHYNSSATPTPGPTPTNKLSTAALTFHITTSNFSLNRSGDGPITANITAGVNTSMGKYVEKQLTLWLMPRPQYLISSDDAIWGENTVSAVGSLTFSGDYNSISGDVKVNGTVTVSSSADHDTIDGDLFCPYISWPGGTPNFSKLSYSYLWTQNPTLSTPNLGDPQLLFTNPLNSSTQILDDTNHEYIFPASVSLTSVTSPGGGVWLDSTTLKPGIYYCNGTLTLADTYTRGSVTFIANKIVINNNAAAGWDADAVIKLGPYWRNLLCWSNASGSSAISIEGAWSWHACASIEGVLYAPNGEIVLAGSGRTVMGFIAPAELYNGAIVAKDLTISGSYWNIYRW